MAILVFCKPPLSMSIANTPAIQEDNPVCFRTARTFKPREYLFESPHGAPYKNGDAAHIMEPAVNRAGLQKSVSIHTFQHSFAARYTCQGVHIRYRHLLEIRSPLDDMEI
ncbi:MAG: phage integrase family protein [Dehalococcoidales bacterium]|nr:phage integrase family protein [Dehalococcoidales bacterium]